MFFDFGIKDIIDIFLVAVLLYNIYRLMKESRSLNVFIGIMVFVVLWLFVSQVLEMRLLGSIMDKLVSVGVLALIVLFQEDIRKFLYTLGAHQRFRNLLRFFSSDKKKGQEDKETIMPIVMACMDMSKGKVGALIVHRILGIHAHQSTLGIHAIESALRTSQHIHTVDAVEVAIKRTLVDERDIVVIHPDCRIARTTAYASHICRGSESRTIGRNRHRWHEIRQL